MQMNLTIGRIVLYNTTEEDRKKLTAMNSAGICNVSKQLPAIVVAVWGDQPGACINISVILDGEGTLWKTSIHQGDQEGQWNWPVIVK